MKKPRVRLIVLSVMLLALAVAVSTAGASSDGNAPVYMTFAKADPEEDFIWNGSVSGDVNGDLETRLVTATLTSKILHVEFDWIVDGDYSFTARLQGILDLETGQVTMNGEVTEGDYLGAEVHEAGQLVDPANSGFAGTIRIMPASGD